MKWLTGVVVLIGAGLAWLVATVAVALSTAWSVWAILPLTLLFALLVGAVSTGIARDPRRRWGSLAARCAVGVLVGVVVGELAAMVVFSGSVPSVARAQAEAEHVQAEQAALDGAANQARVNRDAALVVARCEYNPTPACPQTRITGVPGQGPESHTANEFLADAQRQLDSAFAERDKHTADVAASEQALARARDTDRGLGARWVAMHSYTLSGAGPLVLWAATIAFFVLLNLLPLILRLLRSEQDRAEQNADTAITVKRAEVRATIENMWAEQQLASARLAIEAQTEIDREMHRRRVLEAIEAPVQAQLSRASDEREEDEREEDVYLPIEAEAKAASEAPALPARIEDDASGGSPLPSVTRTAARWIRPLVPPIVARAIDTTTHPLRTARQVFEEVEEITFTLKRTHKVTVGSEESVERTQHHSSTRVDSGQPARERHPAIEGRRQLPPAE